MCEAKRYSDGQDTEQSHTRKRQRLSSAPTYLISTPPHGMSPSSTESCSCDHIAHPPRRTPVPKRASSSTSASTSAVLDLASFPHIRDAVVAAAPRESLIALRAASRRLRDLCDSRLVRHIVFTADGVETPDGRIPSEDWYERPEVARCVAVAELATVPTRPVDVESNMCFCPAEMHTCGAEALAPFLTNLQLVRLNNAGVQADYPILTAPRLSLHLDVVPNSLSAWSEAPGKIVQTACVSGADTVTLLVTYHPDHLLNHFGFYYWLSFPPALKHLIIHYRPRVDLPDPPDPRPLPDARELERPMLLQTFANSLCRGTHGGLRYSLVGLDQTWAGMMRAPEERGTKGLGLLSTELFDAARQEGKRLLGWDDETADACLARVSFPSLDEYRAQVNDDLFVCEMTECF
ncbi:hypothetical protein CspeluHIS016_0305880 [Cutaneotrichosporon spelunceum]|uniref:Uncharacterized protein n=1 Tax=Cutaneotrichosporon spelunceum TaxID=1672016 RepID=A0AAD3TU96_9TREE|nr:hypothetical protein CspeluHIS016_0305880 [Cutaneotrichosporon spelunceum]